MIKINPPVIAGDEEGDEEKDQKTIINTFMRELCRRDDEVNRGQGGNSNTFTITEIHEEVLGAFGLDYMKKFIRGHAMEEDPEIEVIDDQKVKLTNKGRTRCTNLDE